MYTGAPTPILYLGWPFLMYRSIRPTGKMTPALADREVLVDFFFPPRLDMAMAAATAPETDQQAHGRLHGEGPEPGRPLAPVRSALLPARPRLLASRPRVPRSRPPPGSAGTSELEPLAAAPGFPQCTARRSSHPFPASRVRPPLPAPLGAPALTPACAGPRTPTAPASVAPRPCGQPSAHQAPVCARELQGSGLRNTLVQSAAPQASAVTTYCVS